MANFLTQQREVAERLGLDLTEFRRQTVVQRWLNRAQKEIWTADQWNFALDRQVLQTVTDTTAGTASVAAGGTAVTGASTAWTAAMVGYYIQFSTSNDWYKITAVASVTALTIEAPYTGTAALSAGTYLIRKIFYSLGSTVDQVIDARQTISPAPVMLINYRDFDIFRPYPTSTGNPLLMILFGQDSSGNLQVGLYPTPGQIENIDIKFRKLPTDLVNDTDTSLIPDSFNETVMIDGALASGYDFLSNGNPTMMTQATQMYQKFQAGISRMKQQYAPDVGKHLVMQNREALNIPFGPRLPFKYGAP